MARRKRRRWRGSIFDCLDEHGIDLDVADARGTRVVWDPSYLEVRGFSEARARTPGFLFPLHQPDRGRAGYVFEPVYPRQTNMGEHVELELPGSQPPLVDSNPYQAESIQDTFRPLLVIPGDPRLTDAAISEGLTAVGVYGLWSRRGRTLIYHADALETVAKQFEAIEVGGRRVTLVLPSWDVRPGTALRPLADVLRARGAVVGVARPDWSTGGIVDLIEDEEATAALYQVPTKDGQIAEALLRRLEPVMTPNGPAVKVDGGRLIPLDAKSLDVICATVFEELDVVLSLSRARTFRSLLRGMAVKDSSSLEAEWEPVRRLVERAGGYWRGTATEIVEACPDLALSPVAVGRRLRDAIAGGELAQVGVKVRLTRSGGVSLYEFRREVTLAELVRLYGSTCHLCGLEIRLDVPSTHPLAGERDHLEPLRGGAVSFSDPAALRPAHRRCNASRQAESLEDARARMRTAEWRYQLSLLSDPEEAA